MSWSAHKDPEAVKEYFDPDDIVIEKVRLLAQWVKSSKYFTVFTGAGVSTSAGIPDFRGPTGVWTLRAQGKEPKDRSTSTLKAMPTATHMGLVQLMNTGNLKYLISQNTDGLHRRSGIPPEKLSELHGNSNLERCISCGKDYMRDYRAVSSYKDGAHDHKTGRTCVSCNGDLHDTIINFHENLPEVPLERGFKNARASDLMLVLGSSLTVSPAKTMPETVAKNGKRLVIVNLQKTYLDDDAAMVIHAKTDRVMTLLMTELGLEIPPFILRRRIKVDKKLDQLEMSGIDVDGTPATIIQGLEYKFNQNDESGVKTEDLRIKLDLATHNTAFVKVFFFGNYNETPIDLEIPLNQPTDFSIVYELGFNPQTGQWNIGGPINMEDIITNNTNTSSHYCGVQ